MKAQRAPRTLDPRDDLGHRESHLLGAKHPFDIGRELDTTRRFSDRSAEVRRPWITLGPFVRDTMTGTANYYMETLFLTGAGTLDGKRISPYLGVDARVVGGMLQAYDNCVAGTAQLNINIDGTDYEIGDVELNTTDVKTKSGFCLPENGIDLPADVSWDLRVSLTSWSPSTAMVAWVFLELDTDGRRE